MKPNFTTIGLGKNKKHILTDYHKQNFYSIFAAHNSILANCDEPAQIKEFLLNSKLILDDVRLPPNIKKVNNFFYATDPNKKTGWTARYYSTLKKADSKVAVEFCILHNLGTQSAYFFEDYVMQYVLKDFIEMKNFYRIEQVLNTAVLLGCKYHYIYDNLHKI